jgi:hypothetical protein
LLTGLFALLTISFSTRINALRHKLTGFSGALPCVGEIDGLAAETHR